MELMPTTLCPEPRDREQVYYNLVRSEEKGLARRRDDVQTFSFTQPSRSNFEVPRYEKSFSQLAIRYTSTTAHNHLRFRIEIHAAQREPGQL